MSQTQTKELALTLMEEVKVKIGENKKDIALTLCFSTREIVLRKFPRPPDDLVEAIKANCQPLFEAIKVAPASAKTALQKYGEQIEEMQFMMIVGPLGGSYDGSRKEIERHIAAAKMEVEAFKLATDFVALLPRPAQDEEAVAAGADASELQLRRLELWNLIWGATFAAEVIEKTIIPQLKETVAKNAALVSGNERMVLLQAESDTAEAAELLQKAAPDSADAKEADDVVKKLRAKLDDLYQKEVEKTRMAADTYKGGDRKAVEAMAKKALLGAGYKSVLRIIINAESWSEPETAAWWDGSNKLHWSRTKSLYRGFAAVETKDKGLQQYRLVQFTFSQSWDWGTRGYLPTRIQLWGWGPPIMKANVNK